LIDARFPTDEMTTFETVAAEIAAAQRRKGVTLDPASDTYLLLGRAIARAKIAAFQGRLRTLRGEPSEPLPHF
jgi:hypothetical protein